MQRSIAVVVGKVKSRHCSGDFKIVVDQVGKTLSDGKAVGLIV